MVVTTDPISLIPRLGAEDSAWLSVHLVASDYATSSRPPEYATFAYNLPPEVGEEEAAEYISAIGGECGRLGVSIVAGHTGSYPGASFTVVGACTMFGFCRRGEAIDASMARLGDRILMTKGAAIEATAAFANSFPEFVGSKVGRRLLAAARAYTRRCSTVKDALCASAAGVGEGGVTSMHDATEGGVLGALGEMAAASRRRFVVDLAKVKVSEETAGVCAAFGVDPLRTLSEGTLLLTAAPRATEEVGRSLRREGVDCFEVGTVEAGEAGLVSAGGGRRTRISPGRDPYWAAYARAERLGLS